MPISSIPPTKITVRPVLRKPPNGSSDRTIDSLRARGRIACDDRQRTFSCDRRLRRSALLQCLRSPRAIRLFSGRARVVTLPERDAVCAFRSMRIAPLDRESSDVRNGRLHRADGTRLLENGYTNLVTTGPGGGNTTTYPQSLIRIGTSDPHLDVEVGPISENHSSVGGASVGGMSDLAIGAKYELGYTSNADWGVNAVVTIPTGATAFSAGNAQYTGNFNWAYTAELRVWPLGHARLQRVQRLCFGRRAAVVLRLYADDRAKRRVTRRSVSDQRRVRVFFEGRTDARFQIVR